MPANSRSAANGGFVPNPAAGTPIVIALPLTTGFAALLVTCFAFAEPLPRQRPDEAVSLHPRWAGILHDPIVDLSQRICQVIAPDPDQVGLSIVLGIVNRFGDGDGVSERVRDPVYGIVIQRPLYFAWPQSVHRQIAVFVLAV